jgi:hypothetical protein
MLAIGTASKEEFQKQVEESARSEMQVVSKAQTIVWLTQVAPEVKKASKRAPAEFESRSQFPGREPRAGALWRA